MFGRCNDAEIHGMHPARLCIHAGEVSSEAQWGTVCSDGFDSVEAQVVCRELGMAGGTATTVTGSLDLPILIDDIGCDGSESSILNCNRSPSGHNCQHSQDVRVTCEAAPRVGTLPQIYV